MTPMPLAIAGTDTSRTKANTAASTASARASTRYLETTMSDLITGCSCSDGTCTDCARDMIAAILAVRQLHRPVKQHSRGIQVCESCTRLAILREPPTTPMRGPAAAPGVAYPCATIRVLDDKGAPSYRA